MPAGSLVYRVFHTTYALTAFKPASSEGRNRIGGGRFDGGQEDPYSFLYAGDHPGVAIAESILRDSTFDDEGARTVLLSAVRHLACGPIEITEELRLLDLRGGRALAALGANATLIHGNESHYAGTREWASALRRWEPEAQGLLWRSRWEPDGEAMILFGDRLAPGTPELQGLDGLVQWFDRPEGEKWLRAWLQRYSTDLRPFSSRSVDGIEGDA